MCYTTLGPVHISREIAPLGTGADYGVDGYRSDCRNYPFNQVYLSQFFLPSQLSSAVLSLVFIACADTSTRADHVCAARIESAAADGGRRREKHARGSSGGRQGEPRPNPPRRIPPRRAVDCMETPSRVYQDLRSRALQRTKTRAGHSHTLQRRSLATLSAKAAPRPRRSRREFTCPDTRAADTRAADTRAARCKSCESWTSRVKRGQAVCIVNREARTAIHSATCRGAQPWHQRTLHCACPHPRARAPIGSGAARSRRPRRVRSARACPQRARQLLHGLAVSAVHPRGAGARLLPGPL
jgi:hypothetical protein